MGADLGDLVCVTCHLISVNDFGGFSEVYNIYFDAATEPTRITVAIHQLPRTHILMEIKGKAFKPRE